MFFFLLGWQLENDWIKEQGLASKAAFGQPRYSQKNRKKRSNSDEEGGDENDDDKNDDDPDKYVIKGE